MNLRPFIKKIANRALPVGSRRRHQVRLLLESLRARQTASLTYDQWIATVESKAERKAPAYGPLISIIVPAFNTPDRYLDPLIDSILAQTYRHWELVLVNGSPDKERSQAISAAARRDERIREIVLTVNEGIAATTNVGLKEARGDFIAFMDHDDTLASFALAEVALALGDDPEIGLFYSDEDKLSDDGRHRLLPFFKPQWSPELFFNVNYLAHFVVVRAELARQAGGIRLGYEGAQDYDFLLRVLDTKPKVHAVQRMSYHWRQAIGSTGLSVGEKSYATDSGLRALSDYARRNHIAAEAVEIEGRPTEYRLKYTLQGQPTVYVWPTGEADAAAFARLKERTDYARMQLIRSPGELAERADQDACLLRVDLAAVPERKDWLTELIGLAQQPAIGWVGAALRDDQGRSLGIGYTLGGGHWQPIMVNLDLASWTLMGPALWPRDVLAVNPQCALVSLSKLAQDDRRNEDVLESCRAQIEQGRRNVYWPFAVLHAETALVPWAAKLTTSTAPIDPYTNPNLEASGGNLVLRP